jgi:exopolyphosphatase / guanosine-5'-triphosphate,3'-diphosphate pyrophosphatase
MKVAIIDLGTNSVRFDVHSLGTRGPGKLLHREKLMIRLGQGVFLKGRMDPQAVERTILVFERFAKIASDLRVAKIVAFGTSALREAQDAPLLIDRVRDSSGIEIKVISGAEEAKLIALGVLSHERSPPGKFALVDIGGGSTEVCLCQGKRVLKAHSFALGTARLQQVFLKRSPPKPHHLHNMREYIRNILDQQFVTERWGQVRIALGSSGTVKAFTKILTLNKSGFSLSTLTAVVNEMAEMNTTQLLDIPGMEPKRVDMILAGGVLLEEICLRLGITQIRPSEFSLRDGILAEERRLAKDHKESLMELHLDDLFERAERLGTNSAHLRKMAQSADELFDKLKPVHRLDPRWKVYLLSAVILRNVGELIGFVGRERHSYYVVKNTDFPFLQGWEHEFVAQLCLHHAGGKVEPKDLRKLGKDKEREQAFLRLLALVRVVDALDVGPKTTIKIRGVRLSRGKVTIVFSGQSTAGIEQLMMERKKKLFEEIFGRYLWLERWKKG